MKVEKLHTGEITINFLSDALLFVLSFLRNRNVLLAVLKEKREK